MPVQLTITPFRPSDIPPEDEIIAAAESVLDSTTSWKEGKTYQKNTVRTFSRHKVPGDGAAWHCRVSEHPQQEATFDELWGKLGTDKAENEMKFIPDIHKVTLVKVISPTQSIWTVYYSFSPPVSPRVFTVLQTVQLNQSSPRTGLVVSIPIDLTQSGDEELAKLEEKGVKGRYVSVERLKELDNGKVEWRMATSSSPGGSIPQFLAERSMASKISEDVPHFIKWLHTLRSGAPAATESKVVQDSSDNPEVAHIPTATDTGNEALPAAITAPHVGGGGLSAV